MFFYIYMRSPAKKRSLETQNQYFFDQIRTVGPILPEIQLRKGKWDTDRLQKRFGVIFSSGAWKWRISVRQPRIWRETTQRSTRLTFSGTFWAVLAVRRWLWGTPGVVASLGYTGIAVQSWSGANLLIDIPKGFHWWSGSCLKCSRFRRCRLRISSNPSGSRSASTLAVTAYIFKGIRPTVRIWSKNMFLKTFFLRSSSYIIVRS